MCLKLANVSNALAWTVDACWVLSVIVVYHASAISQQHSANAQNVIARLAVASMVTLAIAV